MRLGGGTDIMNASLEIESEDPGVISMAIS